MVAMKSDDEGVHMERVRLLNGVAQQALAMSSSKSFVLENAFILKDVARSNFSEILTATILLVSDAV